MTQLHVGAAPHRLGAYYTEAPLAAALVRLLDLRPGVVVLEPHAGAGAFLRAVRDEQPAARVYALDIDPTCPAMRAADLGLAEYQARISDFTAPDALTGWPDPDVIVGNPPYTVVDRRGKRVEVATQHVERALTLSRRHVLFVLPTTFQAGAQRARGLYRDHPPRAVMPLVPRPSFTGGQTDKREYCAIWWDREHTGPTTWAPLVWRT